MFTKNKRLLPELVTNLGNGPVLLLKIVLELQKLQMVHLGMVDKE